ncbi:MAG: NADH-quinone oxidoreductase subunit C [Gammaproteobacteria bacterium]|nr:NADH-quinone oxidoreductase subunit C [Gammaproteobacteria bacterium]
MGTRTESLVAAAKDRFHDVLTEVPSICGEATFEVETDKLIEVCLALRDEQDFLFDMLIDVCGVDYLDYGQDEWGTVEATGSGFSRAVERDVPHPRASGERRFAVVYHLLSTSKNHRLRLRSFCSGAEPPVIDSVNDIWSSANWFEREAFDLFGILFKGHPDLRRLLTDYGFIGHPFRKDFPLIGNVEVRYDPNKGRVVYQPVSIQPRVLVPKVIRDDSRYEEGLGEDAGDA